jgi:hypothetical protein
MSKKLIAVASATALALSALVGVAPAIAAPAFTFSDGTTGGSSTSADPATTLVPSTNVVDASADYGVEVTITGLATSDVVRVTSTGAVKVMEAEFDTANANINVTTLGSQSITKTRTDATDLVLYAYTTSTTAGTVVVEVTRTGLSSTSTKYLKGTAGAVYNVTDVSGVPSTLAKGAAGVSTTFKLTDVFGNAVEAATSGVTLTPSSGLATHTFASNIGWDATAKNYKATLTSLSNNPFLVDISISADPSVAGLPDAKYQYTNVVNSAATASANATATAQIAALTAQLAESRPKATSVTKKRFNTLARKWNRAFPSQAVKLKK